MDERNKSLEPRFDEDDQAFLNLFSSLDSVTASDELKNSTLEAIFSQADQPEDATDAAADADPKVISFPKGGGQHSKPKKRRRHHHVLRIAGVAAAVAAFSVGGIAYATPSSYISVDEGDTTLTLGVNTFGVTVSATANTDTGNELIGNNKVCNKGFADSVRTIATAIVSSADEQDARPRVISASVTSDNVEQRKAIVQGFTQAAEESGFVKEGPAATGIGAPDSGSTQTEGDAAPSSASDGSEGTIASTGDASSEGSAPASVDASGNTDVIGSFVNIPANSETASAQASSKSTAKAKKSSGKKSKGKNSKSSSKKSKNSGSTKNKTYSALSVDEENASSTSSSASASESAQGSQASAETSSDESASSSRTMNPMSVDDSDDGQAAEASDAQAQTEDVQAADQQAAAADSSTDVPANPSASN